MPRRRSNAPGLADKMRIADVAKSTCSVHDCGKTVKARGWCRAHYLRWFRRGGDVSVRVYRPRAEVVGYQAVHARLHRDRGPASALPCRHCGLPAKQWAYDHSDPDQLVELINLVGTAYSLDQKHYIALCGSCHKFFDQTVVPVTCLVCQQPFESVRTDAMYCSPRCRQRAHTKRKSSA